MNPTLHQQLSDIFRTIEADRGTTALSDLAMDSLRDIFKAFKPRSIEDFYTQFKELMTLVKTTKPRVGLLIFHFCEIWELLQEKKSSLRTLDDLQNLLEKSVAKIIDDNKQDVRRLILNGVDYVQEDDQILIHSHSRTVLHILAQAHANHKKFRVILAEQEEEKTQDMIHFLQEKRIPFVVVPEYMLSHIEQEVTKVFLGGVTFTNEYNFVTDAGTNSVISEFHHVQVPVYMFMTTKKFSLWEIEKKHQMYKVTQKKFEKHPRKIITYERIKFSHDRIPVNLVDYVVTEEGVYTPEEIKKVFQKRFQAYKNWRDRYFRAKMPKRPTA